MKLLNRLYQIGGNCLSHPYDASVYLLESMDGLVLLDCGTEDGLDQVLDNIRSLGFSPANITDIYGTHGHYDHVGSAARFKEMFGCRLHLHVADKEQVEEGDAIRTTAGILYDREFKPCKVDSLLTDGQLVDFGDGMSMEVIHTPGHTMGSVCFALELNGYSVLVAGDTVYGGYKAEIGSDMNAWKASMHKLTKRHFDAFTFGHIGPTLLCDADARLKELERQLGVYYDPWFKAMKDNFRF